MSVYEWMKHNESRFAKKKRKSIKSEKSKIFHLKTSNKNSMLDSFAEPDSQDNLFDNEFSKEDFLKLTKKWKEKNLEE